MKQIISVVSLVLLKNKQVLLMKRANTGFYDGYYSFIGGKVEKNESIKEATCREVKEAIGVTALPKNILPIYTLYRDAQEKGKRVATHFFIAREWEEEPRIMEPYKCDDLQWFPIQDLPKNAAPWVLTVLAMLKEKKYFAETL